LYVTWLPVEFVKLATLLTTLPHAPPAHKVLPPVNVPPLAPVMLPTQLVVAFNASKEKFTLPVLDESVVVAGVNGNAGPNVTLPLLPVPHPAPLELVAVA
jgi:hypothetical protein